VNLLDGFYRRMAEHPDRAAVIDPNGKRWTYAQLARRAEVLAAHFADQGLRRGDRVLMALGLNAELYAAFAALWRLGAVAVLPEPALGLAGIERALELAKPRAVLLAGPYRLLPLFVAPLRRAELKLRLRASREPAPAVADLSPNDPALISFTTGSTGAPKAIVRSHGFMLAQDAAVAPLIGTAGRHETDLVGFPVFVIANLGQGITSVLPDWPVRRMDKASGPRMARLIERRGVTRLLLNPALVERLAEFGIPKQVHSVFTGGGPVFPDLIARITTSRPSLRMVAVYGSTEAEPIAEADVSSLTPADFAAMAAGEGLLAGTPVAAVRVRIVDDEIQVAGAHVVQGYLDPARDAETKQRDADGTLWHRTGDAGRFDVQGRLWLLGRMGGRIGNLWPFPVEVAARSWPGVRRAALVEADGQAALVIEGDPVHAGCWKEQAAALSITRVHVARKLPMDRRHGSKIDLAAARALVGSTPRL